MYNPYNLVSLYFNSNAITIIDIKKSRKIGYIQVF